MVLRKDEEIDNRIKTWFYATTTPEFRSDAELMYSISPHYLMSLVKKAGAEHILNRNLDFQLKYHGSVTGPSGKTHHTMSVHLAQDKETIHSETYTITK